MAGVSIDASEVRTLAADMRNVTARLSQHVRPVVEKGAVNIKADLQEQARKSRHFAPLARAISYDITGGDKYEAEIGPETGRPGSLGNIAYFGAGQGVYRAGPRFAQVAYFGTAKGGGTVEDPSAALEREAPKFADALADLAAELVFGR